MKVIRYVYFSRIHRKSIEQTKGKFNWPVIVSFIGVLIASFSAYLTSENIAITEKWKKQEFIANQVDKFMKDTSVIFVRSYLDYFSRAYYNNYQSFNQNEITQILISHEDPDYESNTPQRDKYIKDQFDAYLDRLGFFNTYLKANLFQFEEVQEYFKYEITLIGKPSSVTSTCQFQQAIWSYINYYHFTEVQNLFLRYGYDIKLNVSTSYFCE